jgi:hypothetical protein
MDSGLDKGFCWENLLVGKIIRPSFRLKSFIFCVAEMIFVEVSTAETIQGSLPIRVRSGSSDGFRTAMKNAVEGYLKVIIAKG